jgi:hypothetical protein
MAGMALLMPVNRAGAVEYEIFPRDQPTVWPHNNGVQQARFFDAQHPPPARPSSCQQITEGLN